MNSFRHLTLLPFLVLLGTARPAAARAGVEATRPAGERANGRVVFQTVPATGGIVTSAQSRWTRGRLCLRCLLPFVHDHPATARPPSGAILVSGSVQGQFGYSHIPGSHVDITVLNPRGQSVERIAARYLPGDLTVRPRDPLNRRSVFAETLATPPAGVRTVRLSFHSGPDHAGEAHP